MRTRLAPSPTGPLHLGNARTFLVTWLLARQAGGRVVLRLEDLDARRVKPGASDAQVEQLAWLGLDWDEGPIRQSARMDVFASALARLEAQGLVYPCVCSRREIETAGSAPTAEEEREPRYPGTCRGRFASVEDARAAKGREPALRFRVPEGAVEFDDGFRGPQSIDPSRAGGDFVVRSPDGMYSYQLAVVADDAAMAITDVIRGDDLLSSTPRQILLYRALGRPVPRFTHLPLVLSPAGEKLAKRRRDLDLAKLIDKGVAPGRVVAWLAGTLGMDVAESIASRELIARFDLARMSREPTVVTDAPL